jgi:AmpD protein
VKIEQKTGLLLETLYIPSPNCNERPAGLKIDMIVIHNISLPPGEFGGPYIDDLFCNRLDRALHPFFEEIVHLEVSSHCLIRRDGVITQYVPFTQRAWHAGISSFRGQEDCNDFSIGIELEGADEIPYSNEQYVSLVGLIKTLMSTYNDISLERIVGHSTIAPDRKTDPGTAFDWNLLKSLLQEQEEAQDQDKTKGSRDRDMRAGG